jgi:hypothetical protein
VRFALIGLVVALCWPATAQAVEISGPAWAQQAVDAMRVPVPPGQAIVLGACPGYASEAAACNFATADSAIYIDPQQFFNIPAAMRAPLYRELGGRFATLAMYPWAVEHFERILRRQVRPLTVGTVAWSDVSETFEDAYADCAFGLMPRRESLQHPDDAWVDDSGYDPSRRQHARVCALIGRVGARAGYETPRPTSRSSRRRPAPDPTRRAAGRTGR